MPNFTHSEFLAAQQRLSKANPVARIASGAVDRESKLANAIKEFCDSQRPQWKYLMARTDQRSTIGSGVHDITIWAPHRVFCFELKSKTGKLKPEQQTWKHQMAANGHEVKVIRSMKEFMEEVK